MWKRQIYCPARSREIHKPPRRCTVKRKIFIEIDSRDYYPVHQKAEEEIQAIEGMPVRLSAQALQGTLED